MGNENPQLDRLEGAWRELGDTIRRREAELSALKHEFKILDQARALLIMRTSAGTDASVSFPGIKRAIGLKEAILECISASELGLTLSELCTAVATKVDEDRYANERSLVAAVQTTVRRMIVRGEIALTAHGAKSRYVIAQPAFNGFGSTEAT